MRFLEERLPGVRGQEPLSAESIAAFKNSRRDRFGYIEGRRRYVKAMYGAPLPVEVGIIFTRKEPLAGWNRSWSAE